jgi:hypothetical protein
MLRLLVIAFGSSPCSLLQRPVGIRSNDRTAVGVLLFLQVAFFVAAHASDILDAPSRELQQAPKTTQVAKAGTPQKPNDKKAQVSAPSKKQTTAINGKHLLEATRELQQSTAAAKTTASPAKPATQKPATKKVTVASSTVAPKSTGKHLLQATATKAAPARPGATQAPNTKKAQVAAPSKKQTIPAGRHLLDATKPAPTRKTPQQSVPKSTTGASTKKTSTVATGRHLLAAQAFKAPGTPTKAATPKGVDSAGKHVGWGLLLYYEMC